MLISGVNPASMAAPAAVLTRGERLAAEFAGKQVLLTTLFAEPALRAQVALASLGGTKEEHYDAAAMYSLPMLRALTAIHGPPADAKLARRAAGEGHLACLQYLHEHGCPWDAKATDEAAREGRLACLQYAHENGCPWSESTTDEAARGGHLACLQYAHENGCPWDANMIMLTAVYEDHKACIQYLEDHGLSFGEW
jgi:hypothetical protein